jgi:hypothetical protein
MSGSSITGDSVHVVIVETASGDGSDPGHGGTGTLTVTVRGAMVAVALLTTLPTPPRHSF